MGYRFVQFDGKKSVEVGINHDDVTWWELQEQFFSFLQGCGFTLTREDLAEQVADAAGGYFVSYDEKPVFDEDIDSGITEDVPFEIDLGCGGKCGGDCECDQKTMEG